MENSQRKNHWMFLVIGIVISLIILIGAIAKDSNAKVMTKIIEGKASTEQTQELIDYNSAKWQELRNEQIKLEQMNEKLRELLRVKQELQDLG